MNWVDYYKGSLGDRPDSVFPPCMLHDALVFFDYFKKKNSVPSHYRRPKTEDRRPKTEDRRPKTGGQDGAEDSTILALLYSIISYSVLLQFYTCQNFMKIFFLATWLYFKFHLKYSSNPSCKMC